MKMKGGAMKDRTTQIIGVAVLLFAVILCYLLFKSANREANKSLKLNKNRIELSAMSEDADLFAINFVGKPVVTIHGTYETLNREEKLRVLTTFFKWIQDEAKRHQYLPTQEQGKEEGK